MDDDDLATPTHGISTGSTSGEQDVAWKLSLGTEEESTPPLPSHDPSNDDGDSHNDWARQRPSPVGDDPRNHLAFARLIVVVEARRAAAEASGSR